MPASLRPPGSPLQASALPPAFRRTSSAVFEPSPRSALALVSPSPSPAPPSSTALYCSASSPDPTSTVDDLSVCCISGGTGGNAICTAFGSNTTFVLPISDDGGSSSEILRCLGGPSIGDIRSRLIRLSPPSLDSASSAAAVARLLSHRFPWNVPEREAKALWREVVEGESELWEGIDGDRREVLHRFFVYFESELLQRAHKAFSFRNCSLGNVLLSSAQRFFLSLPAAIFLFSSVTGRSGTADVIPAILTNHVATIAAQMGDGSTVVGQCNISHPTTSLAPPASAPTPIPSISAPAPSFSSFLAPNSPPPRPNTPFGVPDGIERSSSSVFPSPSSMEASKGGNLAFVKPQGGEKAEDEDEDEDEDAEDARAGRESERQATTIERIFYINPYGQEIYPSPNPSFLSALSSRCVLVYSCGSLWTSIMPCLALEGVGSAIATSPSLTAKVLLLNSSSDRETRGYTAGDYVDAIVRTLNRHDSPPSTAVLSSSSSHSPRSVSPPAPHYCANQFITHLVSLDSSRVPLDSKALAALGIQHVVLKAGGRRLYDAELAREAIERAVADGKTKES